MIWCLPQAGRSQFHGLLRGPCNIDQGVLYGDKHAIIVYMKKAKSPLEKIKEPKRTQAVVENLILSELLSNSSLDFLRARLKEFGDIVVGTIEIFIIPSHDKKDTPAEKKKRVESLTISQPSPNHLKARKVIVTTTYSKVLDNILK